MNFSTTKLLFLNTIQKEFRSKTLIFLFLFTFFGILAINVLLQYVGNEISLKFGTKDVMGNYGLNIFFWVINTWSVFLSSFFGINSVQSDRENNVLGQLLSFPIHRFEYLLSRVLGTSFIVFSYYLISVLVAVCSFSLSTGTTVWNWGIVQALFFVGITILSVVILSILLSEYLPKMIALLSIVFLNFLIFISGNMIANIENSKLFSDLSVFKIIGILIYYLFPRISILGDFINSLVLGTNYNKAISIELTHFFAVSILWWFVLSFLFSKKDV